MAVSLLPLSLILFLNFGCSLTSELNFIEHNQTMRIELRRQKTPFEHHLNSPLEKYGISLDWIHQDVYKKGNKTINDTIALYRYLNQEFYGLVVIGKPGVTMNVAFDTTWTYTWLLSAQCNGLEMFGCYFHNKYDHTRSSEYKPDGTKFEVNEGSYKLKGFFSYENISISHSNVTNYSFVEMTSVPNIFIFNKADGVLGLGRKVDKYDPFFYTLRNQKKINGSIFSVYINRNHQSSKGGNIYLGFVNVKHIKKTYIDGKPVPDPITYLPADPISYWQIQMDKLVVYFNKDQTNTFCAKGCKAIIDSGSSTTIGPVAEVDKIHELIKARKLLFNRYSVECDRVNELPKIVFIIGGTNFTLTGQSYIKKITWKSISVCLSTFQAAETPDEQTKWILGTAFLSEVYSIFDVDKTRVGLVRAA